MGSHSKSRSRSPRHGSRSHHDRSHRHDKSNRDSDRDRHRDSDRNRDKDRDRDYDRDRNRDKNSDRDRRREKDRHHDKDRQRDSDQPQHRKRYRSESEGSQKNKRTKYSDHVDTSKDPLKYEEKKETLEDYIDNLTKQYETEQNRFKGVKEVGDTTEIVKELPWFEPSGILAEEDNKINGVVLKFNEPLDASMPDKKWRFYVYKGEEELQPLYLHRQSWYLVGRDQRIWDILLEHPSISSQHAVIQYREYKYMTEEGEMIVEVRPYIIDLESTNKTMLNGQEIEPARYYELMSKDILNFGQSTRDYVLMEGGDIGEADSD